MRRSFWSLAFCAEAVGVLTQWLKLVMMRHGETIAMLLEDCAGGRRVSHISEARRKRCFGTTCVPFGVHFCCFVFRISVLCPMGATVFILRAQGVPWPSPGLHFWSSGDALVSIFPLLGVSWAAFLKPWEPVGLHFGQIGGLWVSIFPLLGVSWAAFWWPWGFFGLLLGQIGGLWGALGVPMPPQPPKT